MRLGGGEPTAWSRDPRAAMAACDCSAGIRAGLERRTLITVLAINAVMFGVELLLGLKVQSTGLIADSLDMLADAGVYGLSLAAVGRSLGEQRQAAVLSGRLQIVLAIWVLLDVLRRTAFGSEPISALMVGIGSLALLANLLCLLLVSSDIRFWSSGDTKTGPPDGVLMGA